jgi:hypothetical protein
MLKIYNRVSLPQKAKGISRELQRLGIHHKKIKCGTRDRCDLVVFEIYATSETVEQASALFN